MKERRCPFSKNCPYHEVCKDHSWFCVWGFWVVLAAGFTVISVIVWRAAQG
jgi:hypothetical protein